MSQKQTVTINGRLYDALTGLPIKQASQVTVSAPVEPTRTGRHATEIHNFTQRSKTLNRSFTPRPEVRPRTAPVHYARQRTVVAKSEAISKFAPHPQRQAKRPTQTVNRRAINDIAPTKHPVQNRADIINKQKQALAAKQKSVIAPVTPEPAEAKQAKSTHTPSQVIKNQAIESALSKAPTKKQQEASAKKSFWSRYPRVFSLASASLALIMLAGYFTYLNMPSLSVRVAAAQAGINATYPDYHPDGYRLNGPVAADQGKVEIDFASTTGSHGFKVTQSKSSWDSSAVVANLVGPESNDSYITTNERGLTIFTYDGNAAWVNGGLLYTIEGDAPLSSEQVRRIATSL